MKKSVIILIGIIYVASIALVSFFGLQAKIYNEKVYVEKIELLNTDIKSTANGEKYVVISPDENGERKYQILYRVYPDNATNSSVDFVYDTENENVSVDQNGIVTFTKGGAAIIQILATDGSNAKAQLTIYSR